MPVFFYFDDVQKPKKFKSKDLKKWITNIERKYQQKIENIQYIFVTDEKLLEINQHYLQHHTYTDIITFNLSEHSQSINGEIYISIERIGENAKKFKVDFLDELLRVMAHGLLHLIGFNDKKKSDKIRMTKEENSCIALYYQTTTPY